MHPLRSPATDPSGWLARLGGRTLSLLPDRVPILMYHRVHPEPYELCISPAQFEAQMRFLREAFQPVSLTRLVWHLKKGESLPDRAVVVTFDDGYLDNYTHALPLLLAYGIPATFFVASGHIEETRSFWWDRIRRGLRSEAEVIAAWPAIASALRDQPRSEQIQRVTEALKLLPSAEAAELIPLIARPAQPSQRETMTWSELGAMQAAGMEIGSHTVTHPILARQPFEEASWEILHSKRVLEDRLGSSVLHFSYPNGRPCDFSAQLVSVLKAAGYESACATVEGPVNRHSDRFALPRIGIYHSHRLRHLLLKLARPH